MGQITRHPEHDSCAAPSPVERLAQLPGQLSFEDTPEWQDAMSRYLAFEDRRAEEPATALRARMRAV